MVEKVKNVNLRLSPRVWAQLLAVSSRLNYSRAGFIRSVLEGVAYAKDPSMYVPRRMQPWMTAVSAEFVRSSTTPTVRPPIPIVAQHKAAPALFPGEEVPKLKDDTRICSYCFSVVEKTAETCTSCGRPYVDKPPEKYTPGEYEIPADWVNEYGMTVEQQNAQYEDDYLEYRPAHKWLAYKQPESY